MVSLSIFSKFLERNEPKDPKMISVTLKKRLRDESD